MSPTLVASKAALSLLLDLFTSEQWGDLMNSTLFMCVDIRHKQMAALGVFGEGNISLSQQEEEIRNIKQNTEKLC